MLDTWTQGSMPLNWLVIITSCISITVILYFVTFNKFFTIVIRWTDFHSLKICWLYDYNRVLNYCRMFINVQLKRFRDTPKLEEDQDYQRHLNVVRSKTQPLLFSLDSFPLTEIFFNEDKFISTVLIALAVSTHVPLFTEIGILL